MKLTKEQILHVARLARLGLEPAEVEKFQKELSGILDYVGQLNEVNTDGIEPTAQVTGLLNRMRPDAVSFGGLGSPDQLIACSSLPIEERQIKVKKVFD